MPPPTPYDIMAILGRVAGAQQTFQTQLESMGNTVSELATRVQACLDANTATSTRVQDLATELSAHQTNFYGSLARLEKTIAASPGQGTSRLTAPTAPGTAWHSTGPAARRPWGFSTCTGLRIPAGQASLGCAYAHPNCPSCAWAVFNSD